MRWLHNPLAKVGIFVVVAVVAAVASCRLSLSPLLAALPKSSCLDSDSLTCLLSRGCGAGGDLHPLIRCRRTRTVAGDNRTFLSDVFSQICTDVSVLVVSSSSTQNEFQLQDLEWRVLE